MPPACRLVQEIPISSVPTWSEDKRLEALRSYDILDTPSEADFDDIVKLAAEICGTPISLISLVETDRQWFKAKTGTDVAETPIEQSICAHAILHNDVVVIPDTTQDERSNCNTLVTGDPKLRFYAGAALLTPENLPIGMLCVLDTKPNNLDEKQTHMLQALARQVMTQLELRRALRQQEQEKARYHELFTSIDQAFCVIEMIYNDAGEVADYRFMETNPAFEKHTGLAEVTGKTIREVAPDIESHWFKIYGDVVKTGKSGRFSMPAKSLNDRWFDAYAFRVGNPTDKRVAVVFADISAMRESERASAYLGAIIESSGDAIISKDLGGNVTSWNKAAERIFGYTAEEMVGEHITLLIPPDRLEEEETILTTLKTGKRVDHFETLRRHKDGHLIPVSLTISPIRDTSGAIIGASKISRDISEWKRLETETREAKERAEAANIAKTEFLANMSHEIRTPMNAVIGLSNIISMSKPLTEKQQEYIKTLRMSADSLLSLINDLLDIAKIESHSVELEQIPFSIEQLAEETISMMNVRVKEKGLTFNVVQDCARIANRQVLGDPTRVRQILLNLCSNAIKFTESGGIELHISCTHEPVTGRELVRMAVTDTGIGIPTEKLGDIFHKFTQADSSITRKYGGTGLGLAITKTLAEIMGGSVELTSELGKGSTFTVTLPFDMVDGHDVLPMTKADASKSETAMVSRNARVLLVEDYEPNVLVASTFLEGFGYEVDVASNGFEAIEKVKQNNYIAALMDVQMHGMNGLEATQSIRAHEKQHNKPRVYIIGMTAHALVGDRERCLGAGMDDYIAKPFNPDKLEEMLGQLAEKSIAA